MRESIWTKPALALVHDNEKVSKSQQLFRIERSTVLAPVSGIVTNFDLLPGRYVNVGTAVFALIDSDSFRVEGYFEETKLRRIRVGEDGDCPKRERPSRTRTHHGGRRLGYRMLGCSLRRCTVADRGDRRCSRLRHSRVWRALRESDRSALAVATDGGCGSAARHNARN
jgi:hypothetical protein